MDSELQWFSQLGKERFSRRFGIDLPRLVVLEVKTKPAAEVDVDELLYPLAPPTDPLVEVRGRLPTARPRSGHERQLDLGDSRSIRS